MPRADSSSAKMYVSSHTSERAPSIARVSAGKYSSPPFSSAIAWPGVNRFIVATLLARGLQLERGGQRRVVGDLRGGERAVHVRLDDVESARVDAIEPEHRHDRREGPGGAPGYRLEHFDDAELVDERAVRLVAPVVEVAGDHERRVLRHGIADALAKRADLPPTAALEQSQVDVDAMQLRNLRTQVHHAVEQAARLEAMGGDVLVVLGDDRVAREHRIAVMPVAIYGILAIRHFLPVAVGDVLVLRLDRPVAITTGVPVVQPLHFLQEDDVRIEAVQAFAKLVDHHALHEAGKALVDVVRRDGEAHVVRKAEGPACILANRQRRACRPPRPRRCQPLPTPAAARASDPFVARFRSSRNATESIARSGVPLPPTSWTTLLARARADALPFSHAAMRCAGSPAPASAATSRARMRCRSARSSRNAFFASVCQCPSAASVSTRRAIASRPRRPPSW